MDVLLDLFHNTGHLALYYLLPFIIVLGIMVFFHELGHFVVAKFFGVKVLKFALGFGPKIVARDWGETEYSIRYVPLGGFVKMLGENEDIEEDETIAEEDIPKAFNNKHPLKRMVIVVAGPFFNVVLAFLLYWGLFFSSGTYVPSTEIGYVPPDSPASKAGLIPGDIIKTVDGKAIKDLSEIQEVLLGKGGIPLEVLIERRHELVPVTVIPQEFKQEVYGREIPLADIGILPLMGTRIDRVTPDSPASRAGLLQGDIIRLVNGKTIKDFREIKDTLLGKVDTPVELIIERDNELVAVTAIPEKSIHIGIEPLMDTRIDWVDPESPANRAGLLQGDIIRSVDGKTIKDFNEIKDSLRSKADTPVELIIERDNELIAVAVIPEESIKKIDGQEFPVATLGIEHLEIKEKREYGFWSAGIRATVETWTWIARIYHTIVKLLTGTYSMKMIGGPIMIGQAAGDVAQAGLIPLLGFTAMISVNLGIINLFPIPILDGGLIILLLVELVMGKPLSMKTQEWVQKIGLFLIAILMAVVIYNDIGGVVNQIP